MTQTFLIFRERTAQTTIDWHVQQKAPAYYYTTVPPQYLKQSVDEDWTFPKEMIESFDTEI